MSHLTPREIRCAQSLARRFETTKRMPERVSSREVVAEDGESIDDIKNMIYRLQLFGLVEWVTNESFEIKTPLLDLVKEINNPPPRNYWEEWSAWWFSKPWLVAVSVLIFVAPILAQYVEWALTLWSVMFSGAKK